MRMKLFALASIGALAMLSVFTGPSSATTVLSAAGQGASTVINGVALGSTTIIGGVVLGVDGIVHEITAPIVSAIAPQPQSVRVVTVERPVVLVPRAAPRRAKLNHRRHAG